VEKVYFTPEKANEILPRVKSLMERIIQKQVEVDSIRDEIENLGNSGSSTRVYVSKVAQLKAVSSELAELISELNSMGCLLKDIEMGLVDFPAIRLGEEVYLCWRIGEEKVDHWHSLYEGYAGRKKVFADEFIDVNELNS
jgi:hypothetical protein